jgi:MoxR-like ATPase
MRCMSEWNSNLYSEDKEQLKSLISEVVLEVEKIKKEISKVIVGQTHITKRLLMAMVGSGHVLLEGLPGLAKTTQIKTLAKTLQCDFKRIQFTPDLLPADLIGTEIFDPKTTEFKVKKGPIFSHVVLADEINRAPAKVQSALLEAMEEKQVTIGDQTFKLEEPFLVMATQNPIEQEGTYALPEAQIDRFFFKLKTDYPTIEEEEEIIARVGGAVAKNHTINPIVDKFKIRSFREVVDKVYVAEQVRKYIVSLIHATRFPGKMGFDDLAALIECGASPRASLNLDKAARVNAMFEGRSYVTPQDVKDVGMDVLRHRVKPTYEAEAERISSDEIVRRIFERVDVP